MKKNLSRKLDQKMVPFAIAGINIIFIKYNREIFKRCGSVFHAKNITATKVYGPLYLRDKETKEIFELFKPTKENKRGLTDEQKEKYYLGRDEKNFTKNKLIIPVSLKEMTNTKVNNTKNLVNIYSIGLSKTTLISDFLIDLSPHYIVLKEPSFIGNYINQIEPDLTKAVPQSEILLTCMGDKIINKVNPVHLSTARYSSAKKVFIMPNFDDFIISSTTKKDHFEGFFQNLFNFLSKDPLFPKVILKFLYTCQDDFTLRMAFLILMYEKYVETFEDPIKIPASTLEKGLPRNW